MVEQIIDKVIWISVAFASLGQVPGEREVGCAVSKG
jgi:hypothetical protein